MSTRSRKQPKDEGLSGRFVDATQAQRKARTSVEREARVAEAAAQATARRRLQGLDASSMPWLSKGVDVTPTDGGPETSGRATYTKPVTRG